MRVNQGSIALKRKFNSLFGEARTIDRVINPHPITRMPVEIVRAIFEAAARADPDATLLLTMTCEAWKRLVIETSKLWSDIRFNVSNDDMLETLHLSLLLSKNWPLDISITGVCASDEIVNGLTPHVHRIRALELFLYREARVPFRVLGSTPPDGLSSLSRLAIESASYNENSYVPSKHPLERANDDQNTIDETDLFLINSLPLLSSLNALVLHAPGIVNMVQLQLPRVESLRLVMKDAPMVLENLTCNNLKSLDVVLDDTSREGWWDLLAKSLTFARLESLALDVTLDRLKNEWSTPWDSREFKRLTAQPIIRSVTIALSFSDRKYISTESQRGNVEYLCGDLLRELTESVPSMKELRLLHVPYLHAPFIWPSPEVLYNLQRLEMQVPAIVWDEFMPVVELPNLRDLRYYGHVSQMTQLPRLRTPSLEYLEIMHHLMAIHPVLVRVDRHWPNMARRPISSRNYDKSRANTSKEFPPNESLPKPQGLDLHLPIIHQSVALRELRLYFGKAVNVSRMQWTDFPELRALHCSVYTLRFIVAPKLEELHLLWSASSDATEFSAPPEDKRVKSMLHNLTILDIYSHFDPKFHANVNIGATNMDFGPWMLCLHSLQTLILGLSFVSIDRVIAKLRGNPTLCPKLTTIDSFGYPRQWAPLRDCIEKRNHLAMQDPSVHPIRALRFPLALHRNISDRLKESLSGEFAGPFVAVPLQPHALGELTQPSDGEGTVTQHRFGKEQCFSCVRSGNTFECLRPGMGDEDLDDHIAWSCTRHRNRGADRGVTITAYNVQLSGYLEGA